MEGRYGLMGSAAAGSAQERKEEEEDEFYLESFNCPILQEPFQNPAMAADGHTYELSAFQRWVAQKKSSPLTGYPLASTATQDNYAMKKAVAEYKEVVIPKLKTLKELTGGQLVDLEALKKAERENLEKEKEIEQLKRVEKAFHEQRLTLNHLLQHEHQTKNRLQALEVTFFRQSQTLEQTRSQLREKELELTRLKQERPARQENPRPSCSFAALFSPLVWNGRSSVGSVLGGANGDLVKAIQSGHLRGVVQALAAGANVNQCVGLDKATPLILAIRLYVTSPEPAQRIIEVLGSHGAQPNIGDSRGDRPLHLAAYHNLVWPVTYLLNLNANPLLKNQARETPSAKLLKQRTFNGIVMNRLLRAESRFLRYPEEGQLRRPAYNPAQYEEAAPVERMREQQRPDVRRRRP